MKTENQLVAKFYQIEKNIHSVNMLFLDMVQDGMTKTELKANIKRRPQIWKRFENWMDSLPE